MLYNLPPFPCSVVETTPQTKSNRSLLELQRLMPSLMKMKNLFKVKHFENNTTDTTSSYTQQNSQSSTWVDHYLPKEKDSQEQAPKPSLWNPSVPNRRTARINAIKDLLSEIHISVNNRERLIELAQHDPEYLIHTRSNQAWKKNAKEQNRLFYALQKEVNRGGGKNSERRVIQWEEDVEFLRKNTLNLCDKMFESGEWKNILCDPKVYPRKKAVTGKRETRALALQQETLKLAKEADEKGWWSDDAVDETGVLKRGSNFENVNAVTGKSN
ncbi:hypothetical protein K469DRAFT_698315 [Zopfia rhizophila CBS 207.26]|uniref:Uncharacterized protein n=1 Tax=Zopfia rhizophila CBS 207.26 TaxID=1314779 RepID=A0A6A6DAY0_9PEZI|nr:hypothetical protein K469DRAFT_698315 [Zopfia rhizophila CBS 207.26]